MRPEWKLNASEHITTRGLQIAQVKATAPGYPSATTDSTLGGTAPSNAWRHLAGLPEDAEASPSEDTVEWKRERSFQTALSGGFTVIPWEIGSPGYSKAYKWWLEWFISAKPGTLPRACKQITQDFDELIQQTSLRRRFMLTDNGQLGFGPEGAEEGDVLISPGGKVSYILRKVEASVHGAEAYRLLGDAFLNGAMAGEKVHSGMSGFKDIIII
ncbi:hypothetical protein F53441_11470 [Fusarium austroafricanum]|uniref:Uncharacterized protein n=1 Tax=Fusarium austroafricanum TaxID=2364996 RepID=A0A8H4K5V0_9HYPO|nr:hypothetical protein F53441_11470 [Fusarium austroafricanum]